MFDKRLFKAQLVLSGLSVKELAEKVGMNESTMYRRIADDGNFTREEISKITEALHIENPKDIFFADELAYTQE